MKSKKVLIIGQAPPFQKQQKPYDSTVLYDWLAEVGEDGSNCEFDAVYDKFPGFTKGGGHKKPTKKQMGDYWNRELKEKVSLFSKIILVGASARDFVLGKLGFPSPLGIPWGKDVHNTNEEGAWYFGYPKDNAIPKQSFGILPHPSKRNTLLHREKEEEIKNIFKQFFT